MVSDVLGCDDECSEGGGRHWRTRLEKRLKRMIEGTRTTGGGPCQCNVRASGIKFCFLSPHRSLPGNFINFDYKYFRFDRIWQITATKKLK